MRRISKAIAAAIGVIVTNLIMQVTPLEPGQIETIEFVIESLILAAGAFGFTFFAPKNSKSNGPSDRHISRR